MPLASRYTFTSTRKGVLRASGKDRALARRRGGRAQRRLVHGRTAGQRHTFWNPTDEPAACLTPIAPAGFEEYLRELALGLERATSE